MSPGLERFLLIVMLTVVPLLAIGLAWLMARVAMRRVLELLLGRVPLLLAGRYLFSHQNRGAINFITLIAVIGVTAVTGCLILILSIFNGFQHFIENRYTAFDPDLRVVAAKGKSMPASDSLASLISGTDGVAYSAPVIEDKAMLTYFDKQHMTVVKGVRPDHLQVNRLDTLLYEGEYAFETETGLPATVLGGTVAYYINSRISDRMHPMKLWAAGDARDFLRNPEEAVRIRDIFANAYFRVQLEYDGRYILVDHGFAADLFDMRGRASAYEIRVHDFKEADLVAARLRSRLGPAYRVETWYDMHATLFDVMKNEKFVAYLILTLVLLIAAVNIIGGLSMIIVEKTRDIGIMRAMGASPGMVLRTFLAEGIYTGMIGGVAGLIWSGLFSYVHIHYGLLRLNGGQSFQDMLYFPMEAQWTDYLGVFLTVFLVSVLAGLYPSIRAARQEIIPALRK